jgi:hypothetical protein
MIKYWLAIFCVLAVPAMAFEIQKMPSKTIQDQLDEITTERMSQDKLPIAKGEFWDKLWKCKIHFDHKTQLYTAKVTDEVKALNGKTVQIPGFMYPLSFEEKQNHILLSKRTPVCFFCPPGEPNELLDVQLAKPTPINSDLVTLEGTFELTNRAEEGIFFVLKDAKLVK